jgi:hypothetical protein
MNALVYCVMQEFPLTGPKDALSVTREYADQER